MTREQQLLTPPPQESCPGRSDIDRDVLRRREAALVAACNPDHPLILVRNPIETC